MKNLLILSALILTGLFFDKSFGINLAIAALLMLILLLVFNYKKMKNTRVMNYALAYLASSIAYFFVPQGATFFVIALSFFTLIGAVASDKSAIYIAVINGFYSSISASLYHYFDSYNSKKETSHKENKRYFFWLKTAAIVLAITTVFILLYRKANPVFNSFVARIDFSFINGQWLFFALVCYYFLHNISKPTRIEPLTENELQTPNHIVQEKLPVKSKKVIADKNQLALILISVLNVLIVMLLVTDIIFLNQKTATDFRELSAQLHQGVNSLILSIVFAIAIILHFFKGNLNFYKHNKTVKKLTYSWIFLNAILAGMTFYKNYEYVYSAGLTYKRIGVFFYIILVFSGLFFTYFKVRNSQNNWYLFRKNSLVAFVLLLLFSLVNWNILITKYNIKTIANPDYEYLISLADNNTVLEILKAQTQLTAIQKEHIATKQQSYKERCQKLSWQEYTYESFKNSRNYE